MRRFVLRSISLLFLTLIFCEVGLRASAHFKGPQFKKCGLDAIGEGFYRSAEGIQWKLKPNQDFRLQRDEYEFNFRYTTDEYGRRVLPSALIGGKKILLIGDSILMGQGMDNNKTLTDRIARILAGSGMSPVNMGVPSYGPAEEVKAAIEEIENPVDGIPVDGVAFFFNLGSDFHDWDNAYWEGKEESYLPITVPVKNRYNFVDENGDMKNVEHPLLQNSKAVPFLYHRTLMKAQHMIHKIWLKINPGSGGSIAQYFNNFELYAKKRNISSLMVILPSTYRRLDRIEGINMVKLDLSSFTSEKHQPPEGEIVYDKHMFLKDRVHFNEYASQLMADRIAPFLIEQLGDTFAL
ncbi:MAG: hypothetical protein JKX97_04440 [Candidatus Lindowbacteria bacterium]|nr:hypothetical protein [Candidatus Lindowbacteria bacterium]